MQLSPAIFAIVIQYFLLICIAIYNALNHTSQWEIYFFSSILLMFFESSLCYFFIQPDDNSGFFILRLFFLFVILISTQELQIIGSLFSSLYSMEIKAIESIEEKSTTMGYYPLIPNEYKNDLLATREFVETVFMVPFFEPVTFILTIWLTATLIPVLTSRLLKMM